MIKELRSVPHGKNKVLIVENVEQLFVLLHQMRSGEFLRSNFEFLSRAWSYFPLLGREFCSFVIQCLDQLKDTLREAVEPVAIRAHLIEWFTTRALSTWHT